MRPSFNLLLLGLTLSSCGGGSTVPKPISPPPVSVEKLTPQRTISGVNFYHSDTFYQKQTTSFAVTANKGSTLNNIKWKQLSGAPISILASNSQVISFDIPQVGDYQIQFSANTANDNLITETFHFSAILKPTNQTSIRLDHVVSRRGNVSLQISSNQNKTVSRVTWQQLNGPPIATFDYQDNDVFFIAPDVNQDEVLKMKGTVFYTNGTSESDTSLIVVKNIQINDNGFFPKFAGSIVSSDLFPYIKDSPHSEPLSRCVYNNQVAASCTFADLPLLGQEHINPEIQHVLERLLVSHQWMGDRFKQFLEQSSTSEDMLKLLGATTAIIISYDVRPSFYWTATGAIYLDAGNFWVTPEERDTLNTQPDYRANFGDELQFFIPWRYVKDNDYYFRNSDYPAQNRRTKTFRDLEANASWLMYHELAHANDFFPPEVWNTLSQTTSPLAYSNTHDASSVAFSNTYGLTSTIMGELAQVSFSGETASNTQKALTASDVASHFQPDGAPAYYSYSSIREDYATLFERFMMAYRLGVSADIAVISQINNKKLIINWGQRDRFNDHHLKVRVKRVVQDILPELDVTEIQTQLPAAELMEAERDWFSNIKTSTATAQSKNLSNSPHNKNIKTEDYWHHYHHQKLGKIQ